MGLNRPDVLFVGGLFGVSGYIANAALVAGGMARWTDTVAATVFLSGICARFLFGKSGLFGTVIAPGGRRFRPDKSANWLPWQQKASQLIAIGFVMGIVSAYLARILGPDRGGDLLGFGIAAVSLVLLQIGAPSPVTHHIALTAALATLITSSVVAGALAGVAAALVAEMYSRLTLIHGDTYIDPPAAAIATVTTGIRVAEATGLLARLNLP